MDERVKHILKFMEYDELTDAQHDLVVSFEEQFNRRGSLSEKQFDILEDIFDKAAAKVEWSR
jgi:hypothetical protein